MIYAVHILDSKFVKIGFSNNEDPQERISALQTGNPYEIQLLFTTFGTLVQEQQIHKALFDAFTRIRIPIPPNEWYPGKNTFFQEFLAYLKYGPNAALAFLDQYNQCVKQPGKGKSSLSPNIKWPDR
jgi:hypothetical protein